MKREFALLLLSALGTALLSGATLERLSLTGMIGKSTAIVRAKVVGSSVAASGPVIYTHYQLQVSEQYKGTAQSTVDLALPGGVAHGVQQLYSGVPQLHPGEEYVFFLWTGKSGMTQLIGLSQGLFSISEIGAANPSLTRLASRETMIDGRTGQAVEDKTLRMTLAKLKAQIAAGLASGGQK